MLQAGDRPASQQQQQKHFQPQQQHQQQQQQQHVQLGGPASLAFSSATNIAVEAIEDVKQQWIASQMKARVAEYSTEGEISVRVGTWNVNGKACTENLQDWIGMTTAETNNAGPDLLALGFQELDTSTEAYLYYDTAKEEYWSALVDKALGEPKQRYYKVLFSFTFFKKDFGSDDRRRYQVASKQLVGILVMIYAKTEHAKKITEVAASSAGCGIMGMMVA